MQKNHKKRICAVDFIRFCEYNKNSFFDPAKIRELVKAGGFLMAYLSIVQTSEHWGISPRRIQILCRDGRVPGAMRIGHAWAIPDDEPKPADARIKSGKYTKQQPETEE